MLAAAASSALSFVVPPLRVQHQLTPTAPLQHQLQLRVAALSMTVEAGKTSDAEEICDAMPDSSVCEQIFQDADAVFAIIDENGDGSISLPELKKHLLKSGYNEAAVERVFAKLDADGDGELSKEELRQGFLQYTPLREAPGLGGYNSRFVLEIHEDADALFSSIDADGNGTIDKEELREHLKTFTKYSFKAISNIYKLLDVNKDGEIERSELRDAFVKYSALRQAIGEGPNFK